MRINKKILQLVQEGFQLKTLQKMSESNRLFYEQNFKVDLASKTIDHHCTDLIKLKTSNPTTSASK